MPLRTVLGIRRTCTALVVRMARAILTDVMAPMAATARMALKVGMGLMDDMASMATMAVTGMRDGVARMERTILKGGAVTTMGTASADLMGGAVTMAVTALMAAVAMKVCADRDITMAMPQIGGTGVHGKVRAFPSAAHSCHAL